ncbi:MAG TPA: hypothetical protein ENH10_00210, partial [Bacteroidetes bacterium]|nr:hypothetical protein [Bacteroidota bacterium]HEX03568.1 hypothetical protein [Bacteroidota bacterium]
MILQGIDTKDLMKTAGLMLAVSLLAILTSCKLLDSEPPADALAVVGEHWITHDDIVADLASMDIDTTSDREIALYVNQWIDTQLLLHEAHKQELHRDPEFLRRMRDLETDVLVSRLMDANILVETPSSQAIVDYWKDHTGEYTRVANEVSLIIARVDT